MRCFRIQRIRSFKLAIGRRVHIDRWLIFVEKKAKGRLDSPLHLAAYYLNPYYYYRDNVVQEDTAARSAMMHCIDVFYPDIEIQDKIGAEEFLAFKRAKGTMGSGMAERYWKSFNGTDNFDPGKTSLNIILKYQFNL